MQKFYFIITLHSIVCVIAYMNYFTIPNVYDSDEHCAVFGNSPSMYRRKMSEHYTRHQLTYQRITHTTRTNTYTYRAMKNANQSQINDTLKVFQSIVNQFMFGSGIDKDQINIDDAKTKVTKLLYDKQKNINLHYPTGNILRAERFQNKTGVHLPPRELLQRDYCRLKLTNDFMQTAVNAFAIFLYGSRDDILNLPADYVLRSARTIAMMKITREKLAATWVVVKENKHPVEVSYETLEMYRPLFKYLNGREMARLNLRDERILTFIGTHADLDRHQVGVVASTYIKLNPQWSEAKYLNIMNNLLCGVPMSFMRRIPENTYLQLTHQVFYHIRACDPLQRRFYLSIMTRTQALGKSYSWSARDVSRLGLLLAEVDGSDLSAIKPEAMSGITAQVMLQIPAYSLTHIKDMQMRYISPKSLNILTKKLQAYQNDFVMNSGNSATIMINTYIYCAIYMIYVCIF